MQMEITIIFLTGLLALGILIRQFAVAARGKGCGSCKEAGGCSGRKKEQEEQFMGRCK